MNISLCLRLPGRDVLTVQTAMAGKSETRPIV
jgi:hypothetical protein